MSDGAANCAELFEQMAECARVTIAVRDRVNEMAREGGLNTNGCTPTWDGLRARMWLGRGSGKCVTVSWSADEAVAHVESEGQYRTFAWARGTSITEAVRALIATGKVPCVMVA